MNTAALLTRLTMIAAALAAAVMVQAAPPVTKASDVVTLPMVTVVGKREPAMQVVTLPMVTVIGKRGLDADAIVVAQKTAPGKV
jgi:hypothetical protein